MITGASSAFESNFMKMYLSLLVNLILFLTMQVESVMMPNDTIVFKKETQQDIPLFARWFAQPHVQKWWPVLGENEVMQKFLERIRSKDTFGYVVMLGDMPIGYIQYYYIDRTNPKAGSWLPELPKETVGLDQFIGEPDYIGKGYGTQMIKNFIAYLVTIEPQIITVVVDPDPENFAAVRCYEKVGFTQVGSFETQWGTSLLMQYDIR